MKNKLKALLTVALIVLLTGCYKINVNMAIDSDKSMNFEMIYAIDMAAMEGMGGSMSGDDESLTIEPEEQTDDDTSINYEDYKDLAQKGYSVEKYEVNEGDKKWKGVKITKKFSNIDDISKSTEKTIDFIKMFEADSLDSFDDSQFFSLNNGKYKASFTYDFTSEDTSGMSGMDSIFDLKYVVTLPNKSISNNASEVSKDGKTLTWNLKMGDKNEINYEFSLSEGSVLSDNIVMIAGGVLLAVVIIVVIIIFTKKKKTPPTVVTETINTPPVENTDPIVTNPVPMDTQVDNSQIN